VGALRTAESSGRLRARALSRRTIDTEAEVRRRLAEMIHDGPIQELSSVELMLASAEQDLRHGNADAAHSTLSEARGLTRANIRVLRDEIVELGPAAFEELTFNQAIDDCIEVWERRYGFDVQVDISGEPLPADVAGALFRITQEAIANAGKHAQASTVAIRLRRPPGQAVLEVEDDGRGFGNVDPLGPGEPGHIGLESMRERAEMLAGRLEVQGRNPGACIRVTVPL
jgi:signal transduction histidine kinase